MLEPEPHPVGQGGGGGADAEGFHSAEEPVLIDEAALERTDAKESERGQSAREDKRMRKAASEEIDKKREQGNDPNGDEGHEGDHGGSQTAGGSEGEAVFFLNHGIDPALFIGGDGFHDLLQQISRESLGRKDLADFLPF